MGSPVAGWVFPHLRPSPAPCLPRGFPLAATRAVTHAVKILPSPGNYKQQMRLDSRALRGIGGCGSGTPGKGWSSPRALARRRGGLSEHPHTGRDTPSPSLGAAVASTPSSALLGKRKSRSRGEGAGDAPWGFFPWSHAWAGKASHPGHTHTGTPPKHRQQELITGIRNCSETCPAHHTRGCWAEGWGQGARGAPRARRGASQLQDSSRVTVCQRDDSGGISGI